MNMYVCVQPDDQETYLVDSNLLQELQLRCWADGLGGDKDFGNYLSDAEMSTIMSLPVLQEATIGRKSLAWSLILCLKQLPLVFVTVFATQAEGNFL